MWLVLFCVLVLLLLLVSLARELWKRSEGLVFRGVCCVSVGVSVCVRVFRFCCCFRLNFEIYADLGIPRPLLLLTVCTCVPLAPVTILHDWAAPHAHSHVTLP